MKKNMIISLSAVICVFTIAYFVLVGNAAKVMGNDFANDLYNSTIKNIETQAVLYGEYKNELFNEGNTAYITVSELAKENFIRENSEGIVLDPRDNSKTLNDVKVKLSKEKDEIKAKVLV